MKNKILGIITIAVVFCISFSCNDRKSLQELLQEERKAIDRFIAMNDFVILKDYPKDGVFKDNEYFKTDDGLFLQVVDSGNGKRVKLMDDVSVRFDYYQLIKDFAKGDTVKNQLPFYDPFNFVYGIPQTYSSYYSLVCQAWVIPLEYVGEEAVLNLIVPPQTYSSYYSLVCQAWVIPLEYVGEEAVLNLIVPSSIGSSSDNSNIIPVFYKNLRYTRFN